MDRVDGALSVLKANGFPEANIFDAPQAKTDTEAALNAATVVLNKNAASRSGSPSASRRSRAWRSACHRDGRHPRRQHDRHRIGGADSAINEFKKPSATGFYGTVIISPKRHGYETAPTCTSGSPTARNRKS